MDSIRGGKFALANTNKMLRSYKGLTGLKTGYIREAGFCISASAERDGLSLVAVVMAAPTKEERMADAAVPAELRVRELRGMDAAGGSARARSGVARSRGQQSPLRIEGESVCVLEKSAAASAEAERNVPDCLTAPVEEGQQVGDAVSLETAEKPC